MHGVVQDSPNEHFIWIYHPEGNIKRSWNLDSRGDDPKFEMVF